MKARDFDTELRPFLKIFEQVAGHKDVSTVWQDFILICLNWFGDGKFAAERDARMKTYTPAERQHFNEMFDELVKLMSSKIVGPKDWYDPFGNFYQAITGNWKSSAMGQFFTPETVVQFMVQILIPSFEESQMHFTTAEPTSGSGRFIIATHVHNPMGFYWAVDLDGTCAQMTAVNMALHNCCGVVLHANGLWEEHQFFRAYHVARVELLGGEKPMFFPCIHPIATYREARDIMDRYQEYAHYHNLAFHFKEYTTRKKPEPFNEEEVLEVIENSELFTGEVPTEIKQVISDQVKTKNESIKNNQLNLFDV